MLRGSGLSNRAYFLNNGPVDYVKFSDVHQKLGSNVNRAWYVDYKEGTIAVIKYISALQS